MTDRTHKRLIRLADFHDALAAVLQPDDHPRAQASAEYHREVAKALRSAITEKILETT